MDSATLRRQQQDCIVAIRDALQLGLTREVQQHVVAHTDCPASHRSGPGAGASCPSSPMTTCTCGASRPSWAACRRRPGGPR
jgi:hypothetical protein